MPVMKQKSIQPARNIPYSQGILMFNGTGGVVAANTLVKAHASLPTGQCLNMSTDVRANTANNGCVPLWITKHEVPIGKYGVVLPWAIVTMDTSAAGVNIAAGGVAYLQDGVGGVIGPAVGTVDRIVGVCLVQATAVADPPGTVLYDLRVGGTVTVA